MIQGVLFVCLFVKSYGKKIKYPTQLTWWFTVDTEVVPPDIPNGFYDSGPLAAAQEPFTSTTFVGFQTVQDLFLYCNYPAITLL